MTTSLRAPRDEDLRLVYEIVAADDTNELGKPDLDESDVAEWWAMPHFDKSRQAWLLERDGVAVGYAQTHDRNRIGKFDTDAWVVDESDEDAYDQLLRTAMTYAAQVAQEEQLDKREVVTWSVMGRERRAGWLSSRGFRQVRRFYRMAVHLTEAPTPELGPGVTITPLGPDEGARQTYHELMQAAFAEHWGYVPIDYETWLGRVTASPQLDWDTVWLLRVDGVPAAGLKMRIYDDLAFIDNVGTLKEFRGRGLAIALLQTAFAEALRRGMPDVELGVDTENHTGAVRVYEKAGMSVAFAHDEWQRELPPT